MAQLVTFPFAEMVKIDKLNLELHASSRSSRSPLIILLLLLLTSAACQTPTKNPAKPHATLFVACQENETPKHISSPVSLSEGQMWRAYVDVDLRSGCLYTTRLWVAKANGPYKLTYLMPPKREAQGNGMEVLGWAKKSRMLLVQTEAWQVGSDAADTQQVLAIDAATGMVYEPNLGAMLDDRKDRQCVFRVTDAGFGTGGNVVILVRAQISTFYEPGDEEADVPPAKRCEKSEETWSFNFANGEIKRIANSEPLQIFKKFVSSGNEH